MQITDDKKADILLTLWREKHEAAHKMRERSVGDNQKDTKTNNRGSIE